MANTDAAKFSNEYHPNPTTAKLTVSKVVEGQELPDDPDSSSDISGRKGNICIQQRDRNVCEKM